MEDNGVRETNLEYRNKIDFEIKDILTYYSHKIRNMHELSGSTEERVEKVISSIFV